VAAISDLVFDPAEATTDGVVVFKSWQQFREFHTAHSFFICAT